MEINVCSWKIIRSSFFMNFFFYKNILFSFVPFLFAFNSGFSGQSFYDDNYILLYNLLFTSIPIVVFA